MVLLLISLQNSITFAVLIEAQDRGLNIAGMVNKGTLASIAFAWLCKCWLFAHHLLPCVLRRRLACSTRSPRFRFFQRVL